MTGKKTAGGRTGVDRVGEAFQLYALFLKLTDRVHEMLDAAA
jgi:hypothetical protein